MIFRGYCFIFTRVSLGSLRRVRVRGIGWQVSIHPVVLPLLRSSLRHYVVILFDKMVRS
jgi:hypothetical protein